MEKGKEEKKKKKRDKEEAKGEEDEDEGGGEGREGERREGGEREVLSPIRLLHPAHACCSAFALDHGISDSILTPDCRAEVRSSRRDTCSESVYTLCRYTYTRASMCILYDHAGTLGYVWFDVGRENDFRKESVGMSNSFGNENSNVEHNLLRM